MAESIFARVRRVVSGRVEDQVDAMERANNDSVMREAIREVDRAVDVVRKDQQDAMTRRLQAARQQKTIAERADAMTAKAEFALNEGREDLAEGALTRQVDLEEQVQKLRSVQDLAKVEEEKLEESLSALSARKREMEEALAAFQVARTEVNAGGLDGVSASVEIERKMEKAEAAFDRAMSSEGGVGFSRSDVEAINQVAEIDTMSRRSEVSDRLAALKSKNTKAA